MTTREGETYRFGVPICYEDVMPYVCRRFVWGPDSKSKRVDFLLNISNDGWFLHRNELPQHFAICTFRAVENRVGVARAVNTGISGFIRPDGRAHDKLGVGEVGTRVARISMDSRVSVYSRTGDVFAFLCLLFGAALYVDYVFVRARAAREGNEEGSS
jgi:apolipoprotein N-acyltransferase